MKKLILASMILLATGAAHATVGGLATDGTTAQTIAGPNTIQVALNSVIQEPQTPIVISYSVASTDAVTGAHNTGAVVQYASITVPNGTNKVKLTTPVIEGINSAHAKVSIIADVGNTAGNTDKLYATATGGDNLLVGLVAGDTNAWTGGETTGLTTVTFYAS
ncbi:hypothetical protein DQC73_22345 [Salmonella enterica subsp. diarizonae]|nr:hypothetical protein [Salmonella enterica subsp. diarizonae]